jgi:hypothetical protein
MVNRVSTRSSTKDPVERPARTRKKRSRRKLEPSSDSDPAPTRSQPEAGQTQPRENADQNRIPADISSDVRSEIASSHVEPPRKQVSFSEVPVIINPDIGSHEYNIIQDIRNQKANVTIGQLLHDNTTYQKLIREAWTRRRKKRVKLPAVAVNFTQPEDAGAPEVTVEIEGCSIPKVPVDGGSGVNLMLEDTAFDLGFTSFEATEQVLRMADQSRVNPVGKLSQVATRIGGTDYLLNYVVIRVLKGRPFPLLLGRPWLYSARVLVDWGAKELVLENPTVRIPWVTETYLGETSETDGYTSDWTDPEDSVSSYFVDQFEHETESNFGFSDAVLEHLPEGNQQPPMEDRSLGESNVPLTSEWINHQIRSGELPTGDGKPEWGGLNPVPEEAFEEKVKTIVSPTDYEKVDAEPGKGFFLNKLLDCPEKSGYLELLKEYLDVFAWVPSDLTGIPPHLGEHHIDLTEGSLPVRQRQYRLNPKYSLMVKEEIDRLLEAGFIYPVNNSEWVSPIVVVPKKVGTDGKVKIRVCQDFRKLNASTKKDYFPLPFTDIILDHVAGHECYSFLDGFSGYNQVSIRNCDQLKTTFTTEWGTFAFTRMPFGLCNAPGTFQRLMMDIFKDFLRHFIEVFIDDFAVFSDRKDHLGYLRKTFQRCRETSLKLHPGKCFFGMDSGLLLGHVVSQTGLQVDLEKVKAILTLLPPTNIREIRGFLGCVGYYRRFIDGYAKRAIPLTELLKQDTEFLWTGTRQQAFEDLKTQLAKAPILSVPDWGTEFHVTIDASGWCLGSILWQFDEQKRENPIYYASRQMSPAERNYTTTEREALAVVYSCKKFRHYLLGYKVVFHTDHDSLKYLVNKPDLSGRIARWILLLQEFDYEVVVKSGKSNSNADYLSRLRGKESIATISADFPDEFSDPLELSVEVSEPKSIPVDVFHLGSESVSEYQDIIDHLVESRYPEQMSREEKEIFQRQAAPYTLIKGVLFKQGADDVLRRCLEPVDRKKVIRALHAGSSGGHFAFVNTINRIRSAGYWWPYLHRDVREFVKSCDQCQRIGAPSFRNHWPLTPIIPLAPFEKWGIDFIGPIHPVSTRKKRYIILATDYATKWVEAKATRKNDAETSASFLFEEIMMRFGHPLELVSDRGTHFLNDVIVDLTDKYLIKHRKTTPYNPKANGLTERANGIIGKILNKVVSAHKTDWDRKLPSAIHAYNTTEKTTTGKTPYFLVFGQEAVHGVELQVETFRVMAARNAESRHETLPRLLAIEELEEVRNAALERTKGVQTKRKEDYDRKIPADHGIREGGLVLLYDNRHKDFPGKLHTRWMGPFRVTRIFENGSLQLQDLQGQWLDTRVNGSRVKKYVASASSDESA